MGGRGGERARGDEIAFALVKSPVHAAINPGFSFSSPMLHCLSPSPFPPSSLRSFISLTFPRPPSHFPLSTHHHITIPYPISRFSPSAILSISYLILSLFSAPSVIPIAEEGAGVSASWGLLWENGVSAVLGRGEWRERGGREGERQRM